MFRVIRAFAEAKDLRPAVALLEETFGRTGRHAEALGEWAADPDRSILVAVEPGVSGGIIGISVAAVWSGEAFSSYAAFGIPLEATRSALPFASLPLLAVAAPYRRQAIGTLLSQRQFSWICSRGCKMVVGVCWEHGGRDASSHLFEKGGFKKWSESKEFYREQCRSTGVSCPRCGVECRCTAVLYRLVLET